jgi:hypothetical protein
MQKIAALCTAPFWKKIRKYCLKIVKKKTFFFAKNSQFLAVILDFFNNGAL